MKALIVLLAAAAVMAQAPSLMAQTAPPAGTTDAAKTGTKEGGETSDRTPETKSATPETQVDTTKQGETSDRTPSKDGAVKDPSKMAKMECTDAELMKMNSNIDAMSAGSGKTMATDHMKMAKDSMTKSDMSGCSMHMNEAMSAMEKK